MANHNSATAGDRENSDHTQIRPANEAATVPYRIGDPASLRSSGDRASVS